MFYNDHDPPHFHAVYGEYRASVGIDSVELIRGELPRRALALVVEWASTHRDELLDDWRRAREHAPLVRIEPLQ